jgi:excisionase family DNA binding protein
VTLAQLLINARESGLTHAGPGHPPGGGGEDRRPSGVRPKDGRSVGYAVLAPDVSGEYDMGITRRVFWVKDYDRSEEPTGIYAHDCPSGPRALGPPNERTTPHAQATKAAPRQPVAVERPVTPDTMALLRRLRVQYRHRPTIYRDLVTLTELGGATFTAETSTLTAQQAADLTGLHPVTIRRACREKRLTATRHGRDWHITRAHLAEWMLHRAA